VLARRVEEAGCAVTRSKQRMTTPEMEEPGEDGPQPLAALGELRSAVLFFCEQVGGAARRERRRTRRLGTGGDGERRSRAVAATCPGAAGRPAAAALLRPAELGAHGAEDGRGRRWRARGARLRRGDQAARRSGDPRSRPAAHSGGEGARQPARGLPGENGGGLDRGCRNGVGFIPDTVSTGPRRPGQRMTERRAAKEPMTGGLNGSAVFRN
jgi:hypothetical protein